MNFNTGSPNTTPRSLLLPLLFLLCCCSEIPGKLLIMEANAKSSKGMFNEAITPYMKALDYAEAEPYGEFALGSVYFAMGEDKAALDRFARALSIIESQHSAGNRELNYRIHYNTGVVLLNGGDFTGAADSFREALRVNGNKVEAKRNLELSLKSLERETGGERDGMESESKAAFQEYFRQKELNQWRSLEWPEEEETTGPDY